MTRKESIRIGGGAGYGGDRFEPALELVQKGNIDYLIYECLAERTIALYQQNKLQNPELGYNPQMEARLAPVLKPCYEKGIKIITNMGSANPESALRKVKAMAAEMGLKGLKVAAVIGDDVYDRLKEFADNEILETGEKIGDYLDRVVSANAYLGAEALVQALEEGADVVLTGRVADPSLSLAPLMYEFGWSAADWEKLGKGTLVGHLLECGGQVTGGYFADPGYKDVPRLAELGFPIAEVSPSGNVVITKVDGSGGLVSLATCKEQMLYEIHDPASYLTPDCVADFSGVHFAQVGTDRVAATGAGGRARPETLKVSIGYKDSFIGEGEMSYGGPGALERAKLAGEIVRDRLQQRGIETSELRIDLLGVNSLFGSKIAGDATAGEVRLRVAGRTDSRKVAALIGQEVETLYTNGPAGGGGARQAVREVLAIVSTFIPRSAIQTKVLVEEV